MFLSGDIMKKIISLILILLMVFSLTSCGGDVSDVKIDYGKSEIYTKEDMDAAIEEIKCEFRSSAWHDMKLLSITYSSDSFCNEENIAWLNDLAHGEIVFDQVIEFYGEFYVSDKAEIAGGLEHDSVMEYGWYLGRSNGGEWHLMSWGLG